MARVLVGALYHGENEYERCLSALAAQRGVEIDHFVIENQTNKRAHEALYQRFMQDAGSYDFLFKLDADMVLRGDNALSFLAERLSAEPQAYILMTDVADWPSRLAIPGVALYRSDCVWEAHGDQLNVDASPRASGAMLRDGEIIVADHMPDPSPFQLFRYGVHKGLKALQPDRDEKDLIKTALHTTVLNGIARHWRETQDKRLMWALIGARAVFTGSAKPLLQDYAGDGARAAFDALEARFKSESTEAEKFWRKEAHAQARWLNAALTTRW